LFLSFVVHVPKAEERGEEKGVGRVREAKDWAREHVRVTRTAWRVWIFSPIWMREAGPDYDEGEGRGTKENDERNTERGAKHTLT
jgi:hypothetical protein